ncbi:polysaccharide deacetylase family protein [Pelagicoccus albus]|uniref:Polysaccharide deacetylase family protein n=1 Tax=Pelagicoccus albus TaxID=415222 RepID=A0A7X1B9P6_9BACT|nr:polysaccharide deacetylase family protein [Pelagicoccus albus]MBC2608146.1 polysaccharide deacetylase family protein [Pelagicoccus albus]
MRITPLALCFTFAATLAHADESAFHWPHGAGAAVCLTYDDSLASQIDVAYPQLEAAGLKGTFFLQGNGGTMESRVDDWRQIAEAGHELASHSLMHPCRKGLPGRDWVADKYDLDQYNLERLESEMEVTNILLHAIDGQTDRTFAYPCGDTAVSNGTQPFLEFAREFFVASRGVSPELGSMRDFKFSDTPAFSPDTKTFEECVAYLEDCYAKGTVAIFLNHGVGGDYLVTDAKLHEQILEYLAENQDRFWIDTFKNVTLHAKSEFDRLDWPIE